MYVSVRHNGDIISMYNVYWYQAQALRNTFKNSPNVEVKKESEEDYYDYIKQIQQEHESKLKEARKKSSKMYWWEGDSC